MSQGDSGQRVIGDLREWTGQPVELVFSDPNTESLEGVLLEQTQMGVFLKCTDETDQERTVFCPWTAMRLLRL